MPRQLICSCKFDTILSSRRSPSFVGAVVSRKWHTIWMEGKGLISAMKLSLAICATAASAAIGVALWPHASDAWLVLGSQDDPAALSGAQLDSALRRNPGLIH